MLGTSIFGSATELEAIAPEWRALLASCPSPAPVSTPTWLLTWWSVFGHMEHRRLCAVAFRDASGKLVGLAPLLRRFCLSPARGLGGRRIELLASGEPAEQEISSDFIGVLAASGHEDAVAEALATHLTSSACSGWDELRFTNVGRDSRFLDAFRAQLHARCHLVEIVPQGASPYAELPASWDEYLKVIGGRRRYFVRRTLRDITAWSGEKHLALHEASSPEELRFAWNLLGELHQERWKAAGGCGAFANPEFHAFHERVVFDRASPQDGAAQLLWLTVGDRPVAALYNIIFDDKVWFYQMGRSLDVPEGVRPGIAIHLLAIRKAIEDGRREYDFLGRERFYKVQLATDARARVTLRAVRRAPLPLAWEFARRSGRAVLHTARSLQHTRSVTPPDLSD